MNIALKFRQSLLAVVVMTATVGLSANALSSTSGVDPVATRIAGERAAYAQAQAQAAAAQARAEILGRRAAQASDLAERDRIALAALGLRIQSAEARLAASRAQLAIAAAQERQQSQRLADQQRPLMELVAQLQLLTRRPALALFVQPGATSDMIHSRAMIEAVLPLVRQRSAALRRQIDYSRQLRRSRQSAFANVERSTARLADQRVTLARSAAQQRLRSVSLNSTAGLEADRAIALGQDAGDIGSLIERLELSSDVRDRLARLSGPIARPGSVQDGRAQDSGENAGLAPRSRRPVYRLPVVGTVERGLGEQDSDGVRSRGLTIMTQAGAQVVAPADGRIVFAGLFRSFGRIIIIDHGDGWTSVITNMVAVSARVGETVSQGAPIGRAGPVRSRITVELRRAGQPIDIATLVS